MAKSLSKRVRYSSSQWQAMLAEFTSSGLTVAAFCRDRGVSPATFYLWRQRLSSAPPLVSSPTFLELPGVAVLPSAMRWQIELELGDGIILRLAR